MRKGRKIRDQRSTITREIKLVSSLDCPSQVLTLDERVDVGSEALQQLIVSGSARIKDQTSGYKDQCTKPGLFVKKCISRRFEINFDKCDFPQKQIFPLIKKANFLKKKILKKHFLVKFRKVTIR